jgi:ABC-2 type transport system permease protein
MSNPPGFFWLLRHELRVLWRGSILVRTHRYVLLPALIVGVVFQLIGLLVARLIVQHPVQENLMLLAANINLAFLFVLMFSRAMMACIDVIYARGDADFLLASPIPPNRVLAVRMLGVACSIVAPWMLLAGMLANGLAIFGQFWALSIYPMLAGEALIVAALAFALVVALVGRIGPMAARRAGHSLALFTGIGIFILGQTPRFVPRKTLSSFWSGLLPGTGGGGPAYLFARGLLGQGAALLASLALACLVFALVWVFLAGPFARGAISAASYRPGGRAGAQQARFRKSAFSTLLAKDMRLLARFPGLGTQIIYRSLTLVPVVAILLGKVALGVAVTVPLLVFLAGQLALFFISVLAAMDDMPQLVASAPVAVSAPPRAALAASAQASLLVVALPVLAVIARAPELTAVLLLCLAGALASNLTLGRRFPIPLSRAAFGKSQTGTLLGLVLGVSVSSAWALASWLIAAPHSLAGIG